MIQQYAFCELAEPDGQSGKPPPDVAVFLEVADREIDQQPLSFGPLATAIRISLKDSL